jgi:hypothetical protein
LAAIAHSHISLLKKISLIALQRQGAIFFMWTGFEADSMAVILTLSAHAVPDLA